MRTIARMQRGLETLYRVDTGVTVEDFMIDHAMRELFAPERRPREQLLVCEGEGEMSLALFIDPVVLQNLDGGDHDFGDFVLAVEGVSHFIFAIWCAREGRPVSPLELELQAEVDKYVTCLLVTDPEPNQSEALRHRLFVEPAFEPDLDGDERDRYRAANDNAHKYATWLEATFVATRRIPEMLAELRRFYRRGLAGKLATIACAA